MQIITVETKIAAPAERCFLLSLNMDLHTQSAKQTDERAIAGVTHGLIGLGETVTWQGRHFGVMLTQKTLISKYERPCHFQDVMLEGIFRSFEHDHWFQELDADETLMRDELRFAAPLGPLGSLAEIIVLRRYLTNFLRKRNALIKQIAESAPSTWAPFIVETRT